MADFKGLDFGSGIARFGDLMAQGYRDRMDLEMKQRALAEEQAQRTLTNRINYQQAATQFGLDADNPELFRQMGGSFVPVSPMGNARSPSAAGQPTPQISEQAPPGVMNANAAPQVMGQEAQPPSAIPEGYGMPFQQRVQREMEVLQLKNDALMQRNQFLEAGRNSRADVAQRGQNQRTEKTIAARGDNVEQKAGLAEYTKLAAAKAKLMAGVDPLRGTPMNPELLAPAIAEIDTAMAATLNGIKAQRQAPLAPKAGPSDDELWSGYRAQHPSVLDNPGNKAKVLKALKGK